MTTTPNSNVLEILLNYAKGFDGKSGASLTAERYFVAIIDAVDGKLEVGDTDELEPVREAINELFPDHSAARKRLIKYINDDNHVTFLDSYYMMQRQKDAVALAKEAGDDCVLPEILFASILSNLSDGLKTIIEDLDSVGDESGVKETPEAETEAENGSDEKRQDDINREFDELFSENVAAPSGKKQQILELTDRVKSMRRALSGVVFGQDNAIDIFTSGVFRGEMLAMTDKARVRPRATFLFAGPPGVGKTMLAMTAAEKLGLPFERFDMSEYSDAYSAHEFIGSDGTFKNSKQGNFTAFVSKNPRSVILFDEIEKAHISIIHLFLQILDAGRIRDSNSDNEISLSDTILIFTTNAGKQFYETAEESDFSSVPRKVILDELQKDVNPMTGQAYFPAAICSRFASGNVVMFNRLGAHDLRRIAKKEVLRHAKNFENEFGIALEFDERVFTSLLFAEGGMADARAVRSRAEAFFDNELYELFRMTSSDRSDTGITDIERIKLSVELPSDKPEIVSLYESETDEKVLVFAEPEVAELCVGKLAGCSIITANSTETAKKLLKEHDIKTILLDINCGRKNSVDYLNIEDVESQARDFYLYLRDNAHLPIYLLETSERIYDAEEQVSFLRRGVRGVITLSADSDTFVSALETILAKLRQQDGMENLAKSRKVVTFETAQRLLEDGALAEIKLFDFKLNQALASEDRKNVMSNVSKPNVKFADVIGADDAKRELRYFVEYLKDPKKYRDTGVGAPRGVLLYGPPGTGKTMLAKAVASESGVTFVAAEGNQFLKRYVGEGPEAVHELFRTARKYAPAIIFIDEIDAIAKSRTGSEFSQASEEVLTAFLTEMDGFNVDASRPVFVLAATNFDADPGSSKSLDPALMRRFDRRIYIDLPKRDDRIRFLKQKIDAGKAFDISESAIENLAVRSTGMSLAALSSVIELAMRSAIRDGNMKVTDEVLFEAFETFNSGDKTNWDVSTLERVARHEAGHAFICWYGGETPAYLTVVARGSHGGYMQHADGEGHPISTKDELLWNIRTALGGRAAELVYYGERDGVSTGASGDLRSATHIAKNIIGNYGMDEEFGLAVIDGDNGMTPELRRAVNKLLANEMRSAVDIIRENRTAVDALVEALMQKNHMVSSEIDEVLYKVGAVRG